MGPVWLWVLGLVAVLVAIWLILRAGRGEAATVVVGDVGAAAQRAAERTSPAWVLASSRVGDPIGGQDGTTPCGGAHAAGRTGQAPSAPAVSTRPGCGA